MKKEDFHNIVYEISNLIKKSDTTSGYIYYKKIDEDNYEVVTSFTQGDNLVTITDRDK